MRPIKKFLRALGPGVITGAADDDPSGVATYLQAGAQFGYNQLWLALFMLPLMTATQEACARIGAVTGKGLAAVIKENYNKWILYAVVSLVLIANTINIGADIAAMAEAAHLIIPISTIILTLLFTVLTLSLEIFITYRKYANILKWLCLFLFAYPITVFIVNTSWPEIIYHTFVPHIEFNFSFLFLITGILGTTISPYLFFWQASEEVEEERARHLISRQRVHINKKFILNLRIDNFVGMLLSEIATWSIIVVGAAVLNSQHINDIKNAADAAKALEPLVQTFPYSGVLAKIIFALGIIGLGLLSIPILAASGAYALSETFNWNEGLNLTFKKAQGFYGIITLSTLLGLSISYIGIDPMKTLVYAAVINGIVAVPLLFLIGRIAKSDIIMKEFKSGVISRLLVGLTCLSMAITTIAMYLC